MNRDGIRRGLVAPLLTALILLASAAAAQAATITVNTTSDVAPSANECSGGQGDCSLRQAIDKAQPNDIIALPGTAASPQVYTVNLGATLAVTKSLAIEGNGPDAAIIDGTGNDGGRYDQAFRIFTVSGGQVTIIGLTVRDGADGNDEQFQNCSPCETLNANGGGALFNNASVALDNVAFTGDSAPVGGAVSNGANGTMSLTDVSFTNNGGSIGGALFTHGGQVTGTGVTFEDNGPGSYGGGAAYLGGGVVNLTNATIVGNGWASSFGGGIDNAGANLTLINDTFSGNLRGAIETDNGVTSVGNTIIGAGFSDGSDYACVAAGKQNDNDFTTSAAITTDLGYNIDEDGHCGLSGTGDKSNVDARLVPIFGNGGPTRTQALLAGSPALGDPATANCPDTDQRGVPRGDGICDIGAFEAVKNGAPSTPTTDPAQNVGQTSADLAATINLDGEAGGFHFLYGTSDNSATWTATPEAPAGVLSSDTSETETITGLSPGTTYYYSAVADNASGSAQAGNARQFTTASGPPQISNVSVQSVTDTTAKIGFTIDPDGADTTYYVKYGTDGLTQQSDSGAAPAASGAQPYSVTLTGLTPGTAYYYEVVATNSAAPDGVTSDEDSLETDEQVSGTAGSPVSITDSGQADFCPDAPTVDWGDGQQDQAQISCMSGSEDETDYEVTDSHTYDAPGHYLIQINYVEMGQTDQYAQIASGSSPSVTGISPSSGPTTGGTSVTISGTGLTNATAVAFGSTPASSFAVDGDTQITAVAPPQSAGAVDVTVTTSTGTSATSTADRYTYQPPASSPSPTPTPSPGPSGQPAPAAPAVTGGAPTSQTLTGASVAGSVNPEGTATQAFFQYGVDLSQRGPGASTDLYDSSTPPQSVGADSTNHTIAASLTGLIPGALYHVRLVATNGAGTTFGPDQTFTAAAAPAPPPPVLGQSEDVKPVSGIVFIRTPNGQFIPLTGATRIPTGTVIDALHGSLQLVAAVGHGKTDHGIFGGAIFRLTQGKGGANRGLTTLTLLEGLFKGAPSYAICRAHPAGDASAAALSTATLQLLHASAHGKFRTSGRYSAATVRGTIWTIADRCDGTLTHDVTDSVAVQDFVHHKTIILHAGQSYLARPVHPPR